MWKPRAGKTSHTCGACGDWGSSSQPGRKMPDPRHVSADAACRGMSRADALLYAQKQREFASEEGRVEREAFAQAAHKKNLHLATSYLHKKGVWRVRLNATCEIMEIVGGTKGGPPVPGEFSFRCAADGEQPKFGPLSRLDAMQTTYAKTLIDDLNKVARARELAYQHQQACDAEGTGALAVGKIKEYLDGITEKAGVLPPSKSELQEEREREAAAQAKRQAELRAAEERAALVALGVDSGAGGASSGLDDILEKEREKERKKAQKKARQRARKAAARGEGVDASAADGTPAPGEAGDLSREEELDEQFDREMRRIFALS